MGREIDFPRMATQGNPTTLCRVCGVGGEDSHGRCDDWVLTDHLESLYVGPTIGEQLGKSHIKDSQNLHRAHRDEQRQQKEEALAATGGLAEFRCHSPPRFEGDNDPNKVDL
ncbi:hypothetical protein KIW84_076997 [Lathyrus oleraceus]|uniref:Uncharacterized protein n=1 Tax=Pisum sativum TaxID=3888 RepID=A0A9D5A327_PEA|nr:hypothetical protein KIW84_076997 [Pisum sativum]